MKVPHESAGHLKILKQGISREGFQWFNIDLWILHVVACVLLTSAKLVLWLFTVNKLSNTAFTKLA